MGQKLTVVYVEDRPAIAKLLCSGLSLFGITVHHGYTSGEQLLENIDSLEYKNADILIFDIRLPNMTGLELATKLRSLGDERPVVLVSEWDEPGQEDLETLHATFMPKPFNFPKLVQTIWQLAWR